MNRDKIGTQTCYIHQCTTRYVDVHSMSVSQSCLCSFLYNPYIHFKFPKFFIYLYMYMYCIERSVNIIISRITRVNNICFCYVAISDDISTHANFQVDGYHGC